MTLEELRIIHSWGWVSSFDVKDGDSFVIPRHEGDDTPVIIVGAEGEIWGCCGSTAMRLDSVQLAPEEPEDGF